MKKLILASFVLFGSSAFAYNYADVSEHSHNLNGNGVWKNPKGESGDYQVAIEVTRGEKGIATINEKYQFGKKTVAFSLKVVHRGEGFFDIFKDKRKVGEGYCFKMEEANSKTCHSEYRYKGHKGESTLHIHLSEKEVYRMGSFTHKGTTIAWRDNLQLTE